MSRRRKKHPGTEAAAKRIEQTADLVRTRSGTHGDVFANMANIAERWSAVIHAKVAASGSCTLNVSDVCRMMIEMKLSRATFGDSCEVDHLQDITGYSAIGAAYLESESNKIQDNVN